LNQKIKKDLVMENKNQLFLNKLKISLSLLFVFLLIFLTIYFIFDFKNSIKDNEKINVYNEIKKLETLNQNNPNNPNINTNLESQLTENTISVNNEKS
jgi:uncharacterized membrane protein